MSSDPRRLDLQVRTFTTAIVALVIIGVAAYEAVTRGKLDDFTTAWGGIILGVYFGSHVSMNGAGARARQDEAVATAVGKAAEQVSAPTTKE